MGNDGWCTPVKEPPETEPIPEGEVPDQPNFDEDDEESKGGNSQLIMIAVIVILAAAGAASMA